MPEQPEVSDEQRDATKQHKARKAIAHAFVKVSSKIPNPLVESRTVRSPLVPQPEPDTDPLQPMFSRPSRSKTDENIAEKAPVHETRTGGTDAPHTDTRDDKKPAPMPGPQVVDVETEQEKADAAEHRKRSRAAKKAAQTRAQNEKGKR